MQDKPKTKIQFEAPSDPICMTYTDSDNKMIKVHYINGEMGDSEIIQLPPEERDSLSCIIEYADGTIFTSTFNNKTGHTNIHVNKPVIYNPETGEMKVDKTKI